MRKTLNLLVAMFAVVAVCAACSKSDDGPKSTADAIVGKWEGVKTEGWEKIDGELASEWNEPCPGWGWVFNKDGSGYLYEIGVENEDINWSIYQDQIIITFAVEEYGSTSLTIESVSENILELSYSYNNTSTVSTKDVSPTTRIRVPEIESYEKFTFTRRN